MKLIEVGRGCQWDSGGRDEECRMQSAECRVKGRRPGWLPRFGGGRCVLMLSGAGDILDYQISEMQAHAWAGFVGSTGFLVGVVY